MESRLSKIDLNLLTAFQVLVNERSVTGAAKRMFVSQPAMSKTLQRLRNLLDDPLFVRTRQGLALTPKAEQLVPPIEALLTQLDSMLLAPNFDPATAVYDLNILIPDSLSIALLPPLHSRLNASAPNVRLFSDNVPNEHLEHLASGKSDFSIHVEGDYGSEFTMTPLAQCPTVCWMRSEHPLISGEFVSMADLLTYPLVLLTNQIRHTMPNATGGTRLVQFYKDYRLEEIASRKTSQLLTAAAIILNSDAVLIGLPYLTRMFAEGQILLTSKPIMEIREVKIPLVLIQHRRTLNSPLHRWLRQQIIDSWAAASPPESR